MMGPAGGVKCWPKCLAWVWSGPAWDESVAASTTTPSAGRQDGTATKESYRLNGENARPARADWRAESAGHRKLALAMIPRRV